MTTEEKAKAYDEAIKRIENIKTGKCETIFMFTEGLFEHIFPELKESEDERIRKALIKYYSFDKAGGSHALDNITPKQIVAWLEKQGEQKNTWSEEDSDMVDDIVKSLKKYQLQMPNYRVELQMRWLNYLKFIRTWKPSEGQMSALKEQCVCKKSTVAGAVLCELFHDLEKLRGE